MSDEDAASAPVKNHPCDAANCGKLDDHPMIHVAANWKRDERVTITEPSFHFDCLPDEYVDLLLDADGNPLPQHRVTYDAIQAAKAGTHGHELRAFIQTQKTDNDVEPEGHDVVPGMGVVPQTNVEA